MADLRLRLATLADAPLVLRMFQGLAQNLDQEEDFTATLDDVRRDGFGPARRYETVLAETGGRPAGLANYFSTYSSFKGRPCLFLDCIFIEDWARGKNIGRALLLHVYKEAKARGCCRIELQVSPGNPACKFYRSLGMAPHPDKPYVIHDETFGGFI